MSDTSFAERTFELGSETLPVRFLAPAEVGGEYECKWEIGWPDREKKFQAYGHDSLAALLLAIKMVKANLISSEAYKSGRLTHLGHRDLWLPSFKSAEARTANEVRYLNTDLDLFSATDLSVLAAGLGERGMMILHVGKHDGAWRAHLEMSECFETPELTISAILRVVESLPKSMKRLWAGCTNREFNMGFDCGVRPARFLQSVSSDLLARVAAVDARLGITLYPAEND